MKIAVIGAGSYTFGPSVLAQTYLEHGLDDVELALVDPDIEAIELVASVGRRMARERGLTTTITVHNERPEALESADFVICCASPQMQKRTAMDWEIMDRIIPDNPKTEFGGVAGISYSLRQIALIDAVTADMLRYCPDAWLLNVSNPLPRVAQAAHENGIKTAGFCSVASSVYSTLWQTFEGNYLDYPFTAAKDKWKVTTAGVNHFVWLLEFRDHATGEDLMPALRERLALTKPGEANPRAKQFLREIGYLLVPGDDHTQDFLPPLPKDSYHHEPWHGNVQERKERLERMRQIGEGAMPWDSILTNPAWEKPLDFIDSIFGGRESDFHALNLINSDCQITNLPRNLFVETPCRILPGKVEPEQITLPDEVQPLCEHTGQVTDTIVRAAHQHSRKLVHEAVELDPTISDKSAGIAAIDACLEAHADILPEFK